MVRRLALLLTLLAGCPTPGAGPGEAVEPTPGTADPATLEDSWMYFVAQDLGRLAPFEQGAVGDAWLSLFFNDLPAAIDGFASTCRPAEKPLSARIAEGAPCIGLARAHLELAETYRVFAEVHRVAVRQFIAYRDNHPEVRPSKHEDFFAGVTLLQSGDEQGIGLKRLTVYAGGDPFLDGLKAQLVTSMEGEGGIASALWMARGSLDEFSVESLPTSPATDAYRARLEFASAVAAGQLERATALLESLDHRAADFAEELSSDSTLKPTLEHFDPVFLRVLASYHAALAERALGGDASLGVLSAAAARLQGKAAAVPTDAPSLVDGLPLVLFGPHPNPTDLYAAERAQPHPVATLPRLGAAHPALARPPQPELSDLDVFVEGSNMLVRAFAGHLAQAGENAGNVDGEMGLTERFRSHLLRERAVQYQQAYATRLDAEPGRDMGSAGVAALSLLELALDKNPSVPGRKQLEQARLSSRNDPELLARLAQAQLDTKHAYEANDYARPLSEHLPALVPVRKSLAALNSAWNPARQGSVR